jgi:DNA polymerase-1
MALLLIDVSSLIYRAYYSLGPDKFKRPSDGLSNNAVYGVASIMFKIMNDIKDKYGDVFPIACFDSPTCNTTRQKEQTEYKANRPKCPDGLGHQFKWIRELFSAMQIISIEIGGYEADDIIATLANQNKNKYKYIIIASPDKDMNQLITQKNILIYNPRTKMYLNETSIIEKYGFHPKHFTLYQALVGDAIDNITGINGIGNKSASELIKICDGDLDNFQTNNKLAKKIDLVNSNRELIKSNIKMVTLNNNLDLKYNNPSKYFFDKKESFGSFLKSMEINAKALWKYGKYHKV